jgi:stringent starvation protein B
MNPKSKNKSLVTYQLLATFNWCLDNNYTPFIAVYGKDQPSIPQQYLNKDGIIILNINPIAAVDLQITDDLTSFSAKFSGKQQYVEFPTNHILSLFSKETNVGFVTGFDIEKIKLLEKKEKELKEIETTNNIEFDDNKIVPLFKNKK